MKYTIGQAARATGKAKSTISRDVKEGKISAAKNDDGSYSIDPAELHRVYPPAPASNSSSNPMSNDPQPHDSLDGTGGLQAEVERLRERLSITDMERERERRQLADQIEDLRKRLDLEGEERRRLTAILTDQSRRAAPEREPQPAPAAEPQQVPPKGLRGWLHRLTG